MGAKQLPYYSLKFEVKCAVNLDEINQDLLDKDQKLE